MSDGTYLNNVYAARLHKSNAKEKLEDAEAQLHWYRDRMLILASMTPVPQVTDIDGNQVPYHEYIQGVIDEMWPEILSEAVTAFEAQYIVDNPGDCKDELVPGDWEDEPEESA